MIRAAKVSDLQQIIKIENDDEDENPYTFAIQGTGVIPLSVTPATVPGAASNVSATAGNGQATVSWSAPSSNGGSAITSYTITASPGGQSANWSSGDLTATVTGLTNGAAYTFTVTATNSVGDSVVSSPSRAIAHAPWWFP